MNPRMESIAVRGYRSIEDLTLDFGQNLTLLVGANGSGKSNLVQAFELLGRVLDGTIRDDMLKQGGFSSQLHRSPTGPDAEEITIEVWSSPRSSAAYQGERFKNGYRVDLTSDAEDLALLSETLFTHNVDRYDSPHNNRLGLSKRSRLQETADGSAQMSPADHILRLVSGCRVFHFDDTSPDSPAFRRSAIADNVSLHSDASNLASLLLSLREDHPDSYRRIERAVRSVAPFFDGFELVPQGDHVMLRWRERGLDTVFSGQALSSGTVRFVCLATLFLQPHPPATIVLDEPELGLHPFAIHQLADLLRGAAENRQVIAATQSVTLLSQFSIDEVAVVDRVAGATTVSRPDRDQLTAWLEDYSLGELWEMNLLGGRPRAAVRDAESRS